ncbi:MAG: glycosyltransferase [Promethearchaeati archaeon]
MPETTLRRLKVCYFGAYDRQHQRNRVAIKGLRLHGVHVQECYVQLWHQPTEKTAVAKGRISSLLILWRLLLSWIRLLIAYFSSCRNSDLVIVGHGAYFDVLLGKFLTTVSRKLLVYDAMVTLCDTVVEDRKLVSTNSLRGRLLCCIDKVSLGLSDLILVDTHARSKYLQRFGVRYKKMRVLPVGADETIYANSTPDKEVREKNKFRILYFGQFIPLHGLEHVLTALHLLEDLSQPKVELKLIGFGQAYKDMKDMARRLDLKNIIWGEHWLPPGRLAKEIAAADVCVGIFGTSPKADMVIPCKLYCALAAGKPVITRDSSAIREMEGLSDVVQVCKAGEPHELAARILELIQDPEQAMEMGAAGQTLFTKKFSIEKIGLRLTNILQTAVRQNDRS